jgi:hypothetical protein
MLLDLPVADLLASATRKIARAVSLQEGEVDEFTVEFTCKVLVEARADIDALLAKLDDPAESSAVRPA